MDELEKLGLGTLRLAAREGDVENGSVMIGQISGMMEQIKSVDEILQDIVKGIAPVIEAIQQDCK